jgi:alkylation response protein AidB-like acyl-CoA dehydrogenase
MGDHDDALRTRLRPRAVEDVDAIGIGERVLCHTTEHSVASVLDGEEEIVELVARFVDEKVRPVVRDLEHANTYPTDLIEQMKALGVYGLAIPDPYGASGVSTACYALCTEELARGWMSLAGAFGGHSVVSKLLLRFGTEEQRQRFLPRIARGELAFAIGMSEPDSGSDLASVRTRAEKVAGGYKVNGTKIWTSNAHLSDYAIALFRTKVVPDKKHEGLSQFLVDLKSEGIGIRPIIDLAGGHHFNEVHFQNVFVPDDMLVGKDGDGWKQVTTELALERSGPERYLSCVRLFIELIREVGAEPGERAAVVIGRLTAHMATLRQMSLSVAGMLQAGQNPNLEAAVVKDVGTSFEQEIPEVVHALLGIEPRLGSGSEFERVFGYLVEHAPSFSLRGGTREVLRGIIARGLGLR